MPGKTKKLTGRYDTIVNPGLRTDLAPRLAGVKGPAENPSTAIFTRGTRLVAGQVLSLPPSPRLPRGLLSTVKSVRTSTSSVVAALVAADPYKVVPQLSYDIPATVIEANEAIAERGFRATAKCSSKTGVKPYRNIKNIRFEGGWNTLSILGRSIPVGVRAIMHFTAEEGVDATGGASASCSLKVSASASGMAGPVPVTGALDGELSASAGVGGKLHAGGSIDVTAGARTVGTPGAFVWVPEVAFDRPSFVFEPTAFAEVTAGIDVSARLGVGNDAAASATIGIGSSLEFTGRVGSCDWTAKFGQFFAEGKFYKWTIKSPSTPALFTKNLWHSSCGAGSASAPPSPINPPTNSPPQTNPGAAPGGTTLSPRRSVSAGHFATCTLIDAGSARCWGASPVPQQNGISGTYARFVLQRQNACGITLAGQVQCWGSNEGGQLNTPTGSYTDVAVGNLHACALQQDGTAVCWGDARYGQTNSPPDRFAEIVADNDYTCGRTIATNTIKCWGPNAPVVNGDVATQIDAGLYDLCGVLPSGLARCWGWAGEPNEGRLTPPPGVFTQVAAGWGFGCGLRPDGSIECWGRNDFGQATPPAGTFVDLSAGMSHACASASNGNVACWGYNEDGQANPINP